MLISMTGFGSSSRNLKNIGTLEVQLRSINHRFLETVFHLPEEYLHLEELFRGTLAKRLGRGRVTCVLKLNGAGMASNIFDERKLLAYQKQLSGIARRLKLGSDVGLDLLLSLPGVVNTKQVYAEIPADLFKAALDEALTRLVGQRRKEGAALHKDLKSRIRKLDAYVKQVHRRFKAAISAKIKTLATQEEKAVFLKNSDITEELVRIQYHLKNFAHQMTQEKCIGKELDFIAQELSREANTIGAKSIDAQVSGLVVKIKSEIDKVREQLQNVE